MRHRFAKRGSYDVVVGVTTPGDDAGASAVVTVQVGAPLAGPDRKGGGTNEEADAPDHGAATDGGGAMPGIGHALTGRHDRGVRPAATGEGAAARVQAPEAQAEATGRRTSQRNAPDQRPDFAA